MGRPRIYQTKEEALRAVRAQTKEWMNTHKWECETCHRSYHVTTKHKHLKTKKHLRNLDLKGGAKTATL